MASLWFCHQPKRISGGQGVSPAWSMEEKVAKSTMASMRLSTKTLTCATLEGDSFRVNYLYTHIYHYMVLNATTT